MKVDLFYLRKTDGKHSFPLSNFFKSHDFFSYIIKYLFTQKKVLTSENCFNWNQFELDIGRQLVSRSCGWLLGICRGWCWIPLGWLLGITWWRLGITLWRGGIALWSLLHGNLLIDNYCCASKSGRTMDIASRSRRAYLLHEGEYDSKHSQVKQKVSDGNPVLKSKRNLNHRSLLRSSTLTSTSTSTKT